MLTVSESHTGTPESEWLGCSRLERLPAMQWGEPRRVVVVAPHPDDETLGVGGCLRLLARAGAAIEVVAVTDGEGSHPGSRSITASRLARVRTTEDEVALRCLGLGAVHRLRLRLRDGRVSTREDELTERLSDLLDDDTLCLATWRGDGHPDHEAVGRAASVAAGRRGARFVEYPVWAWHWIRPDDPDPTAFPWARARVQAIDEVGQQAKSSAIQAFVSQTEPVGPEPADQPVLPRAVLRRFRRPFEIVFDA